MENRTNPFYELYDRLYAAAAAGTAVIPEDFRLKRAVDGFAPLAQKNKVFAKLHKMCADLLTGENAPAQLGDCLALAEALAVTQGSFSDSSETKPVKAEGFTPHDIPYSKLGELNDTITKAKGGTMYLPDELADLADDPRLVRAFLENCDGNGENLGKLAKVFCKKCGKALVQPLYDSIDMSNAKATGRQIEFIADISGSEQTERFRELAFDENAPAGVRINAINALGRFDGSADDLIELFRTSKNKVATAALEAIARISPPQAEPIFEKLAQKYKAAYRTAFSLARYPVCSQYTRERLKKWFAENPDKGFDPDIEELLRNKNDVYDCFELILKTSAERLKANTTFHDMTYYVERTLIKDLLLDDKYADDYALMIEQLYRRYPDKMLFLRLILEYRRSGGKAFEILADDLRKDIKTLHRFVHMIERDYTTGEIYLSMYYTDMPRMTFCDHIPDKLLELLTEVEPIKRNDPENNCLMLRHLYGVYMKKKEDYDKGKAASLKYAMICDKYYPNKTAVEEMITCGNTLPEGTIVRMLLFTLENKGKLPTTLYTLGSLRYELARQVYNEFCTAAEQLPEMKNKFSEQVINDGLAVIRGAIRLIGDIIKRNDL